MSGARLNGMGSVPLAALPTLAFLAALAAPGQAQPYFARGDYYAGTGDIWGADGGNQLHDDGLHGDGEAGDGIYGAFVTSDQPEGFHQFKIATEEWTEAYPSNPEWPLSNAVLYTFSPGEVIHFRLDTNSLGEGWQPASHAVACDHFSWPGLPFEVIGSAPEIGGWDFGIPATPIGDLWIADVPMTGPAEVEFKFRIQGTWDICNIGIHYNMFRGENFTFTLPGAAEIVHFEFNTIDGRARALPIMSTPTEPASWSRVKGLFR